MMSIKTSSAIIIIIDKAPLSLTLPLVDVILLNCKLILQNILVYTTTVHTHTEDIVRISCAFLIIKHILSINLIRHKIFFYEIYARLGNKLQDYTMGDYRVYPFLFFSFNKQYFFSPYNSLNIANKTARARYCGI